MKQNKLLFQNYDLHQVLLLRHGRSDAFVRGWDGSPKEFQSLCQGQQSFAWACHLHDWEDEIKTLSASPTPRAKTFRSFVTKTDGFNPLPDTSDEEDSGLKRTQRQALKREIPWKSIGASDFPAFVEAMVKEWDEWKKWSSCRSLLAM